MRRPALAPQLKRDPLGGNAMKLPIAATFLLALLTWSGPLLGQGDSTRTGLYVWGAEVNSFRPCGTDSVFWVLAAPELLTRLRTAHDSLTKRPYEPVYVRIRGHRSSQKTDGFAEETHGYFQVTAVLEIRRPRPSECRS